MVGLTGALCSLFHHVRFSATTAIRKTDDGSWTIQHLGLFLLSPTQYRPGTTGQGSQHTSHISSARRPSPQSPAEVAERKGVDDLFGMGTRATPRSESQTVREGGDSFHYFSVDGFPAFSRWLLLAFWGCGLSLLLLFVLFMQGWCGTFVCDGAMCFPFRTEFGSKLASRGIIKQKFRFVFERLALYGFI